LGIPKKKSDSTLRRERSARGENSKNSEGLEKEIFVRERVRKKRGHRGEKPWRYKVTLRSKTIEGRKKKLEKPKQKLLNQKAQDSEKYNARRPKEIERVREGSNNL